MKKTNFLLERPIAHRGLHDIEKGIPENSLEAFKKAIKNNYIIELDVHLLKDGKVVVFHDDNLKRMTGIDALIKDKTYDEIKTFFLQNTKHGIPTFKEVLKLVNGRVPLLIELKYDTKLGLLEDEVIKILKDYNGKYAIQSFNPLSINYYKKKCPNILRGQLSSNFKNKKMFFIKKYILRKMFFNIITKPDFISYDINALPSAIVKKYKKNMPVLGWTVKSNNDYKLATNYCDNIIFEKIKIDDIK